MATVIDELVALLGYDVQGEENLRRFNKNLDTLEKKANKVGEAIGKFAAVAATATATAFAFLGKSVIDTSAKFETYAATLETIEGSAEKAQTALDWIKDFAKTTPYEVDELTAAFVKLRSYGLDPMDGSMTVLGDTAAGMGKSIDQVVEAMADASTFQFERLRELGLVASQAGDQVTFSWTENGKSMTKTIKKTSAEVTKFLTDVWNKKFSGAMIRQSKTWTGMMSNLGDSWTAFQLKIGQAGFFDTVKNKLADLMEVVARWEADGTLDEIAKALSSGFTTAANVVGATIERISTHIGFLRKNMDDLWPTIQMLGIVFGLIVARAFPLTTLFFLLGFAVEDFLTYLEGGESVIGNFIQWLRDIIPGTKEVEDAILQLGGAVALGLIAAFTLSPSTVATLIGKIIGFVTFSLAPALLTAITGLGSVIATGFASAFALLSNPVGWAVILAGVAAALVAYFWDDLVALWNALDFAELGRAIGQGILDGLKSMGSAIRGWLSSILPGMGNYNLQSAGETIGGMANLGNKVQSSSSGAPVVQDNSTKTQQTTVNAPITMTVQQPTQAPAAVGQAVRDAAIRGAQPARMQSGGW